MGEYVDEQVDRGIVLVSYILTMSSLSSCVHSYILTSLLILLNGKKQSDI